MRKRKRNLTPVNRERVRTLRKEMSVSEKVLWGFLRGKRIGFLFRRQHPIGLYALDFYCPEARVCIEVDGEQHEASRQRDLARDATLLAQGILTIRIPSLDLFDPRGLEVGRWLSRVRNACEERTGREGFDAF